MINRKMVFMYFTLVCIIAMGVCFIVDLAISSQITWAAYPLLSIPFGWVVLSPLLIKRYGAIACPCVFMLALLPYLYLLEKITPVSDWFFPLGMPSAITGIVMGWAIYFLYRFIKINIWYKVAFTIFLIGVIVNPIINHFVNTFTQTDPSFLNDFLNIFTCIVAAAIFGLIGYSKNKIKKTDTNY